MKKHLLCVLIAVAVLLLDQLSKYMVEAHLALGESIDVIPGFFQLTYVRNTGAAWSLFAGSGMTFFYVGTIVALIVLGLFYRACDAKDHYNRIALSLMMAGALGNLIDRLCFHYVRDFFAFDIFGYAFPVFNIADCALCIGVFMVILKIVAEEWGVFRR